jgi:hypothetical protein
LWQSSVARLATSLLTTPTTSIKYHPIFHRNPDPIIKMSGETGGDNDDQAAMRSMDELGTPHNLQIGRLFYHFRSTPDPSVSRGTVVVPQLDWEGVRNEMERLSIENQRLKDIIISMHLNPPATVSYRSYQGHASSSTGNGHNLELIIGAGSLTSISSVPSPDSNVRHDGSVADDSVSVSSLPSDQTATTEGPKTDTVPANSQPEESFDCVGLETSSDISCKSNITPQSLQVADY